MREFRSADGLTWGVVVKLPSHSSAMLLFQHPDRRSSAGDRYAWINAPLKETSDPRAQLSVKALTDALSDSEVARLFRRSMPVSNRQS